MVEQLKLVRGVIPVVTHRPTDHGPVLLLHIRAVVLVARPESSGGGDLLLLAVGQQVTVDELGPVVSRCPAPGTGTPPAGRPRLRTPTSGPCCAPPWFRYNRYVYPTAVSCVPDVPWA